MNVEEANSSVELQRARYRELWASVHTLLEMDSILAHDIIHHQGHRNVFHVIGQCLAKAIVHIYLPLMGEELESHT